MILVSNFPNAYREVYTILEYVDEEAVKLIPDNFKNLIKHKMNKEYEFTYDPRKSFDEQNILRETKAIFSYIFLNFWATEKQAAAINALFERDIEKEEREKKEKYNSDDLFKNKRSNTVSISHETTYEPTAITQYKEPIFTKIKNWFRRIFFRR